MTSKPTIALLHGWGASPGLWDSVERAIRTHPLDTIVYEMPGYGSRIDEISPRTLVELAHDAVQILPKGAIWVGWSLGAMVALLAAARESSGVAGVMGVCATAQFCRDLQKSEALQQLRSSVEIDASKALRRFCRSMPSPSNRRTVNSLIRNADNGTESVGKETLLAGLEILSRADLQPEASKINAPVRLVSGAEDPIIPAVAASDLQGWIDNSQLVVLPCGHVPFLECPQLFMEQLIEFVESIRTGASPEPV